MVAYNGEIAYVLIGALLLGRDRLAISGCVAARRAYGGLMIALHDLLVTGHPAQTPVCRDGGTTFDFAAFRARVVTFVSGLHAHTAVRYALCIDDTFDFACALFALLACGKEPVIPANATRITSRSGRCV